MQVLSTPPLAIAGRALLALVFIVSGFAKLASIHVLTAGYVVSDSFPLETMPAVIFSAIELLCGAWMLFGYRVLVAALCLATYVLVTNFVYHAFWTVEPEYQFAQQLLFMKNLSVIAGLFLVAGTAVQSKTV